MKFGDHVVYIENGVEYNAVFFSAREIDDLSGSQNEPLINLGFFKPVMGPDATGKLVPKNVIGTQAQAEVVQFRIDVAHESHEFTPGAKKRHHLTFGGTTLAQKDGTVKHSVTYPGGRWKEPVISTFTGWISEEFGKDKFPKKELVKPDQGNMLDEPVDDNKPVTDTDDLTPVTDVSKEENQESGPVEGEKKEMVQ